MKLAPRLDTCAISSLFRNHHQGIQAVNNLSIGLITRVHCPELCYSDRIVRISSELVYSKSNISFSIMVKALTFRSEETGAFSKSNGVEKAIAVTNNTNWFMSVSTYRKCGFAAHHDQDCTNSHPYNN